MPLAGIQRTRRFAASGKARMRCRHRVDSTSTRLALVVAEMADGNPATNMAKKKGLVFGPDTRCSLDGAARVGLGELKSSACGTRERVEPRIQTGQLGNRLAVC